MQKSVSVVKLSNRVDVKCERSRGVGTNQATLEGTVALQQIRALVLSLCLFKRSPQTTDGDILKYF